MVTKKEAREYARGYVKNFINENKKDNDGKIVFTLGTLIELFLAGVEYSFEILEQEYIKIFKEIQERIIANELRNFMEDKNGKTTLN